MPSVNLQACQKRIHSILMTNRLSPYAGTVGTGSGGNSRYQSDQEITDAILEADAVICQARISTPGDPYRNTWVTTSADLAHGALIPAHIGSVGGVEVKVSSTYTPARFTSSKAEILAMRAHPTLYTDARNWAYVLDGQIFHNGDYARVWVSTFSKSAAPQAPEQDEWAVICGAISALAKDGANTPEIYGQCGAYFQAYLQMLRGESVVLPQVEVAELAVTG